MTGLDTNVLVVRYIAQDDEAHLENDYKNGSADFSDYVVDRTNQHCRCGKTVTFDRLAGKAEGFELLETGK